MRGGMQKILILIFKIELCIYYKNVPIPFYLLKNNEY